MVEWQDTQEGTRAHLKKVAGLKRNKRLGKYRLQKRLGEGGYCEVWKARDCVEGIWVALKIPQADVNGKRDNQTILREVRLVAQLRHPHIVPVKNAEIINGHAVLATEISAGTLADYSKPMGVRRIISIINQVLEGLGYAHEKRVVHCDVTPGNIFLFPNGRAALGDFGIGLEIKGRMKTIDEYGTPGYVAPEQAYGRPTYRSDCFSVGLILYEYLTGTLPRWPFNWPLKGHRRLYERTSANFVNFIKRSLSVDPSKRFANANQMLAGMRQVLPKGIRKAIVPRLVRKKRSNWQLVRREAFVHRYKKVFGGFHECVECGEPIAETMICCPWCGTGKNRFDDNSMFSHICPRCHRGVLPVWHYCPWCYGAGFEVQKADRLTRVRYQAHCKHCGGRMMRFMRYCPWCRRKVTKPWQVWLFKEICGKCGWSVDSGFWNYCPWCKQRLIR